MALTHASQALVDFDTLATEAGAGNIVARTATLALVEPDETRFQATVVDPLMAGFRDEATNTEFKVAPDDQPSARAVLLHMFIEARAQWNAWSASRAAALSPNAGPPAGAASAPTPSVLNLPAPPAGPPPKSFEARGPLVQAYNAKLLDLSCWGRSWLPGRGPRPTSSTSLPPWSLQVVGGAVVAAEEKKPWEPRGVMAVLDGLEAIRLAWVLTRLGAEEDVDAYIAWWDKKARARNVNIEALVQYWTSTATTLAMEMRQRRTFKEVTSAVMADISAFLEAMATPPPKPEPKGKAKPQPPSRRELDTATVDPPPPPPPPRSSKGADRRQEGHRSGWSDQSWEVAPANKIPGPAFTAPLPGKAVLLAAAAGLVHHPRPWAQASQVVVPAAVSARRVAARRAGSKVSSSHTTAQTSDHHRCRPSGTSAGPIAAATWRGAPEGPTGGSWA